MNILPNWATSTTSNTVSQPQIVTTTSNIVSQPQIVTNTNIGFQASTQVTSTKVEGSQFATSHITQTYQASNTNSDFLKKIDEQL